MFIQLKLKIKDWQLNRFFLICFIIGFNFHVSNGQSISELRKLWQTNNFGFLANNQKTKLFSNADFYQYAQTRDEEFALYLKETWHDYSIYSGLSDENTKRPIQQPVFNVADYVMNPPVNLLFTKGVDFETNKMSSINSTPRIRKPESDGFTPLSGFFRFYGQPINISYDKLLSIAKINSVSEDSISEYWKSLSLSNSNHLVDQLMDYRDLLGIGDWGYFQLVKAASNHISTDNHLNSDLLAWALMIRSGYDVRFAFNQNGVTLLFPSDNPIYFKQFVIIDQRRYYLDREMNSQLLVTYKDPFPDNTALIELKYNKALNFNGKLLAKKFLYQWNKNKYVFTFRYNPEVIQFYNDYPLTDQEIYFKAPVSSTLKEDLLGQFYPLLSKMVKAEAVAFLQQFVQKEFAYIPINQKEELDSNRFAEQIIVSKSGDDRSKSVLFSWLIRILLPTPIIGVQFPGHNTIAVSLNEPLDGDYYYLNQRKYYITDPTFINAPIGVLMPEYSGLTPNISDLSGSALQHANSLEIWKQALKMGVERGGISKDIVFDKQGRAFITGYLKNNISFYPFVACFSKENALIWIRKFEGDGNALAFAITKTSDDEFYIAGTFTGTIEMNDAMLQSGIDNADLFFAQFNHNGELIWMNKAVIDPKANEQFLKYTIKIGRSGENITTDWSNEDERNINTGFGITKENNLCFTGSINSTPGMVALSWSANYTEIYNKISERYKMLINNKCHPKVAGIVAVLKTLQHSSSEATGHQLQNIINRYNPSFANENPWPFKATGLIRQLKNENNIVTIQINGGKPFIYNNMKFDNNAKFNLLALDNGDLSIGIISGVQVIVKQMVLPLNSILIDCSTGKLTLDYDLDHTLKTVSL